ncbi:helix-turn-helix transcriptional regulator [Dyadobacter jiangsuensis]|uniref:Putative transcriptional regulator n=1 Tax=Dyadobacter jiangsuensis TaxID=1591085 RepID=A0A2P8GIT2_9BACT|nr:helix-turn-helix transcriptional regulator [Dyadobacter jiangsuensis]PSL33882.1 putative transcriptional regulator [Dyadobacter jiangsuensis]
MKLENTLRIERAVRRMTQAELAERVDVSRQAINAIETGKFIPSAVLAIKLARVFGKPVEDIFILTEDAIPAEVKE